MSTLAVARKDFRDAIRSRALLALTALFVLFIAAASYFLAQVQPGGGGDPSGLVLVFSLVGPAGLLVSIIGLALGYKAIVGERETGRIALLLSLPHTRRDVIIGKFLGRTAVIAVSVLAGFAVGAVVVYWQSSQFAPANYALFSLVTVLLGVTFVAIAVAISATTRTTFRAILGAIGFFALFEFLWQPFLLLVVFLVNGLSLPQQPPGDWYYFLQGATPGAAHSSATAALLPENPRAASTLVQTTAPGGDPFYLQDWFGFVILAVWVAVPLVLGYLRFRSTDL